VASFVDGLNQPRSKGDVEAYNILLNFAPDYLKAFARGDGLAVERYYREAFTRAGDVRADRMTAPVTGSLLLSENRKRLLDVLDYGSRQHSSVPRFLLWLAPQVPSWNATTLLEETVAGIRAQWSGQRADGQTEALKSLCLTAPRPPRYIGGRRNRARTHRVAARLCGSSATRQLRCSGLAAARAMCAG
jgi:hypothetical protein